MKSTTARLKDMIKGETSMAAIGVFDGFSARIATAAGAPLLHASGGAISRSIGYPDVGLVGMTEMLNRIREIAEASDLPVIADADTGYGNELNAARTAASFAAAGVSAMHVEDQTFPKRCGHMDGVQLVEPSDMTDKIKRMKDAIGDAALIIARTDAVAVEGLPAALERMGAYLEAGGDMAFVEGLFSEDEITATSRAIKAPKVINQARASSGDVLDLPTLGRLGFKIALYPGDIQRGAASSMQRITEAIVRTGHSADETKGMLSNAERDRFFSSFQ